MPHSLNAEVQKNFLFFFNTLEFNNIEEKIIIQKALNDDDGLKDGRK
jgi:hypothetical protein